MFLQGTLLLNLLLNLKVGEKIDPVDLNFNCVNYEPNPEKSPVLLIHGLTASHSDWNGVNGVIARETKRKVCAVDLRNHADSPWTERTNIEDLAADIGHFLDKHNVQKVNLIGHSLGGKTAVHYTLNNPHRVNSIVVEDMRPNGIAEGPGKFIQYLMPMMRNAIDSVPDDVDEDEAKKRVIDYYNQELEKMGANWRHDENAAKGLKLRRVNGKWRFDFNVHAFSEAVKDYDTFLTKSTGLYAGPGLFIYGTESDFAVGEDRENILRLFPRAKLVPVEGAGHGIHWGFPQFVEEVVKMLNEIN